MFDVQTLSFRGAPKARTRNPETALMEAGFRVRSLRERPGMTMEKYATP
jgi:hypothetical protein